MDEKNKEQFFELQMLDQQIKELDQNIGMIEQQYQETLVLLQALDEFKEQKNNSEILAPLANGIFVKTQVLDTKNVTLNIGANVMVEKSVEDAKKLVQVQTTELEKARDTLINELQNSIQKAKSLQKNLNKD